MTSFRNVSALARRELRDALAARWFILYTISFAVLGLAVSYVSAASAGDAGLSGLGRTTAGLVNIVLLIIPLMALTAGAASVASDRERGMLAYLLALPVARWQVLLAKFIGLGLALVASICLGLGACAAVVAVQGGGASAGAIAWLAGLSVFLAIAMLALGLLVSTAARKASAAVGVCIFLWFSLVFLTDLGLLAGAIAFRLPIERLFAAALGSPLQVFKMWTLLASDATLDVLGPVGVYASETFGGRLHALFAASLAAWVIVPLALAVLTLSRRSAV